MSSRARKRALRLAPKIGEEVEIPSAEIVLGGCSVTVHPMSMRSLEDLLVEIGEPLGALLRDIATAVGTRARESAEGEDMEAVMGEAAAELAGRIGQDYLLGLLQSAPSKVQRMLAIAINMSPEEELVEDVTVPEVVATVPVIMELNDVEMIRQRLGSLIGVLLRRYGGGTGTGASLAGRGARRAGLADAVLERVRAGAAEEG